MWQGVTLILSGLLAFVLGAWYFMTEAPPRAAVNEPAVAVEEAAEEKPATTPPRSPKKGNSVPAANPRLTRANFERIENGMTEDQVKVLLGEPSAAKNKTAPAGKALQWAQREPFAVIEVEFVNGLSTAKTTTLALAAPSPPREPALTVAKAQQPAPKQTAPRYEGWGKLSRVNFERIKNGMTEAEVTALFGPPHGSAARTTTMEGNTFRTKSLAWRHEDTNLKISLKITVKLSNDKVSGKNWIQIGPPVAPAPSTGPVDEAEERSVAFVKKLGGRVFRAEYKPGKPVETVELVHTKITDAGLAELAGLKHLKQLDLLNTAIGDAGLQELVWLKDLEELRLNGTKISTEGLTVLARLKRLNRLTLSAQQTTDATLRTLRKLRMLHVLNATWTKVDNKRPDGPDEVKGIMLSSYPVTDRGLKELAEFPNLDTLWVDDTSISDAGLKQLAVFSQLKFLCLSKTQITNAGLGELAANRQLRTLWLESTRITDAGLSQLLSNGLEELRLGDTTVGDAGLRHVAAHRQLHLLMLNRTLVTDAGIKHLARLSELRLLDLANTRVSDACLRDLQGLKGLEQLHLSFTQVSKGGVAELQKALPRCRIVHNTAQ